MPHSVWKHLERPQQNAQGGTALVLNRVFMLGCSSVYDGGLLVCLWTGTGVECRDVAQAHGAGIKPGTLEGVPS